MGRSQDRVRHEAADRDDWTQPGSTAVLLVNSVVWMLWWAASMIVGSIRLAIQPPEDAMTDEIWDAGDRR